jgi:predicted AAA+ superfamily ATPase
MEIRDIAEQNPWWEAGKKINDDEKVKEALSKAHKIGYRFEERNKLIIGPRQVGKTTFLKLFIKHLIDKGVEPKRILYFSCETLRDFRDIVEVVRFSDSVMGGKKYILFDEVTFVDEWHRAIKFILDSPLAKDKLLYVTGSSSIKLKKETFPGREIKTEYFMPLSFKEFCSVFGSKPLKGLKGIRSLSAREVGNKAKKLLFHFSEISRLFSLYTRCGGFPRSMYELVEAGKIREETCDIYWKWLVSDIAKAERSERITGSVLLGVLKNYSTRFSLNSVAKEMEIGSHVTVRDYLELLEDLFVLRNVFPFEPRKGVGAFRRMRKVYFTDPFLFRVFKKEVTGTEIREEEVPKLIEGIVSEHLIRAFGKVFYLPGKKEVDFYLENAGIEVKWKRKADKKDFPKSEIKNKILLTRDDFEFFGEENLIMLPVSVFLLLL